MKTCFLSILIVFSACKCLSQTLYHLKEEHPQMGTLFKVLLYTQDTVKGRAIIHKAFNSIDTINAIFSDYLPNSEINRLTQTITIGQKIPVSSHLMKVLKYAKKVSKHTNGAFDVTIGPLTKLWRRAFRRKTFPNSDKLSLAKEKVNYKCLKLYPKKQMIQFNCDSIQLDFGGIAKGYAVDIATKILLKNGIQNFLIEGGGDLYAHMAPPNQKGWKIELPSKEILILEQKAIATSGDKYQFLEWEGNRYAHIINPKTGLGIQNTPTLSIIANSCMIADAWASSLVVIHPNDWKKKWTKHIKVLTFQND